MTEKAHFHFLHLLIMKNKVSSVDFFIIILIITMSPHCDLDFSIPLTFNWGWMHEKQEAGLRL